MPVSPPLSGVIPCSGLSEAMPSVAYFSAWFSAVQGEVCPVHSGYEKSRGVCHTNTLNLTQSLHPTSDLLSSLHISFLTALHFFFWFFNV